MDQFIVSYHFVEFILFIITMVLKVYLMKKMIANFLFRITFATSSNYFKKEEVSFCLDLHFWSSTSNQGSGFDCFISYCIQFLSHKKRLWMTSTYCTCKNNLTRGFKNTYFASVSTSSFWCFLHGEEGNRFLSFSPEASEIISSINQDVVIYIYGTHLWDFLQIKGCRTGICMSVLSSRIFMTIYTKFLHVPFSSVKCKSEANRKLLGVKEQDYKMQFQLFPPCLRLVNSI